MLSNGCERCRIEQFDIGQPKGLNLTASIAGRSTLLSFGHAEHSEWQRIVLYQKNHLRSR